VVTIVGAGSTTLTATQTANGNYSSGSVTATLTVNVVVPIEEVNFEEVETGAEMTISTGGSTVTGVVVPVDNLNTQVSSLSVGQTLIIPGGSNGPVIATFTNTPTTALSKSEGEKLALTVGGSVVVATIISPANLTSETVTVGDKFVLKNEFVADVVNIVSTVNFETAAAGDIIGIPVVGGGVELRTIVNDFSTASVETAITKALSYNIGEVMLRTSTNQPLVSEVITLTEPTVVKTNSSAQSANISLPNTDNKVLFALSDPPADESIGGKSAGARFYLKLFDPNTSSINSSVSVSMDVTVPNLPNRSSLILYRYNEITSQYDTSGTATRKSGTTDTYTLTLTSNSEYTLTDEDVPASETTPIGTLSKHKETNTLTIGRTLILPISNAPVSAAASGTPGQVIFTTNYIYVCIANNTWKRAPISSWA